jgi:DNA-binding winged helix-turn-helix (wHTH) protein
MIDANSRMSSITAFAAAVNGHADPTIAEQMGPHRPPPSSEWDGSEWKSDLGEAVTDSAEHWFAFGPFRVCPRKRLLIDGGVPRHLGSRAFEILITLVERAGEVISKQDLIGRVWPDRTVEESNLKTQIAVLRRTLGDGQLGNRYICTVTGRGYCFVAPLTRFYGSIEDALTDHRHVPAGAPTPLVYVCGHIGTPWEKTQHRYFVTVVGAWRQACRSLRSASSEPVFAGAAEESLPQSGYSPPSNEA